jgi:hypothetical protein
MFFLAQELLCARLQWLLCKAMVPARCSVHIVLAIKQARIRPLLQNLLALFLSWLGLDKRDSILILKTDSAHHFGDS